MRVTLVRLAVTGLNHCVQTANETAGVVVLVPRCWRGSVDGAVIAGSARARAVGRIGACQHSVDGHTGSLGFGGGAVALQFADAATWTVLHHQLLYTFALPYKAAL